MVSLHSLVTTQPTVNLHPVVTTHPKVTTCPMVNTCLTHAPSPGTSSMIKTTPPHYLQVESVEDRWSQDELANPSEMSQRYCVSNFTFIGHQKAHQEHPLSTISMLDPRRTGGVRAMTWPLWPANLGPGSIGFLKIHALGAEL